MALLAFVLILIAWVVIGTKEKFTPSNPPIQDTKKHLQKVMSLPDKKARQKYLKCLSKRK